MQTQFFHFAIQLVHLHRLKDIKKLIFLIKTEIRKKDQDGGNCQVSTTLYNAVLLVPSITVTERHEHSNKVPYVQKGKDAAVAYGSYDLKFKNNSGYNIKIKCSTDGKNITTTLMKLKQI